MNEKSGYDKEALRSLLKNLKGVEKEVTALKDFGNTLKDSFKGSFPQYNKEHNTPPSQPSAPSAFSTPTAPVFSPPSVPGPKSVPSKWEGMAKLTFGTIGLSLFGLSTVVMGLVTLFTGWPWSLITFLTLLVLDLPFLWLLLSGTRKRRLALRVRRLHALMQAKNVRRLDEITGIVGLPPEKIKKDVRLAISQNMLSNVHLDTQETCLIYGAEAYKQYLELERRHRDTIAAEQELLTRMDGTELAELKKFKDEGTGALQRIRQCCDEISNPSAKERLRKLEDSTGKIFAYVEAHPGKLPGTRKFVDYYLPTTIKLTDKYLEFDKTDAPNARQAQREIESALDSIDEAFRNLLDRLTEEDALDISTDITVLQTMLAQEGLTDEKFDIRKGVKHNDHQNH